MNWERVLTIGRWEYMQRVRSKSFILSLVLTPLIMVGFGVLPSLLFDKEPDSTKTVGLMDPSGKLYEHIKARIESGEKLKSGQPAYLVANYLTNGVKPDSALARAD